MTVWAPWVCPTKTMAQTSSNAINCVSSICALLLDFGLAWILTISSTSKLFGYNTTHFFRFQFYDDLPIFDFRKYRYTIPTWLFTKTTAIDSFEDKFVRTLKYPGITLANIYFYRTSWMPVSKARRCTICQPKPIPILNSRKTMSTSHYRIEWWYPDRKPTMPMERN